jgi:hypothetical protein
LVRYATNGIWLQTGRLCYGNGYNGSGWGVCAFKDEALVTGVFDSIDLVTPAAGIARFNDGYWSDLDWGLTYSGGLPSDVRVAVDDHAVYVIGHLNQAGCSPVQHYAARWVRGDESYCDGLLSWWPFDASLVDVIGGRDGIPAGAYGYVNGQVGEGVSLGGALDVLDCTNLDLQNGSAFTVEGWVAAQPLAPVLQRLASLPQKDGEDPVTVGLQVWFEVIPPISPDVNYTTRLTLQANDTLGGTLAQGCQKQSPLFEDWTHVAVTVRTDCDGHLLGALYIDGAAFSTFENVPVLAGIPSQFAQTSLGPSAGLDEFSLYNRALGRADIQAIYQAGVQHHAKSCPRCDPVPPGCVGWWRAEGTVDDAVGGNAGTTQGGVSYGTGEVSQAFIMDGTSGRVLVPGASSLNFGPGADFSIEAWIQPVEAYTDWGVQEIASKRYAPNDSSAVGYELDLVYGQVCCQLAQEPLGSGMSTFGPAGPDLRDGNYHHVAMTVSRSSHTGGNLYVDGNPVWNFDPTSEAGDLSNSDPFRIGNHSTPYRNCFFKGGIDEVSVYCRALSSAEVQAIYSVGTGGKCVRPAPPVITTQPADQSVYAGQGATFSVVAAGSTPLTYQWYLNGYTVAGATTSTLNIPNAQTGSAGGYSVAIANSAGSAASRAAQLTILQAPPCAPRPSGMISWWRAEGTVDDAVGGNAGTTQGGVAYGPGEVGQAFIMDGSSGRVLIPSASSLNFGRGADFSIEAWIQPVAATTDWGVQEIASKRYAPNDWSAVGYEFALVYGQVCCQLAQVPLGSGMSSFGPVGPDLRDGSYHHVAMTVSRNSASGGKLYVDGTCFLTFDPTSQAGDLSNSDPFRIGNHSTPYRNCFFKGGIDEVSVYGRALTAAEVQAIFTAGAGGKCRN